MLPFAAEAEPHEKVVRAAARAGRLPGAVGLQEVAAARGRGDGARDPNALFKLTTEIAIHAPTIAIPNKVSIELLLI